jgi:hypothetical protein
MIHESRGLKEIRKYFELNEHGINLAKFVLTGKFTVPNHSIRKGGNTKSII